MGVCVVWQALSFTNTHFMLPVLTCVDISIHGLTVTADQVLAEIVRSQGITGRKVNILMQDQWLIGKHFKI